MSSRSASVAYVFCIWISLALTIIVSNVAAREAEPRPPELAHQFDETIHPFLRTYCYECHSEHEPEAGLNLSAYSSLESVATGLRSWEFILERLEAKEMPPGEASQRPTAKERSTVVQWIRTLREHEAQRNAGDPGPVLVRRLSNAEYGYTIRDLTGVDMRPTREFPVDPANEAGFDNTGESLAMSEALLAKYLDAARYVAAHVVLRPQGFTFAPFPVITDTDRDKYCVRRIVQFYQRQPTDYAEYFFTAWRRKHRDRLGKPATTLAEFAAAANISPKYLETIWAMLIESHDNVGPIAKLRALWQALPEPQENQSDAVRDECERMRDFVVRLRKKLEPKIDNLTVKGIHKGSQPLVIWKNDQYASYRRRYFPEALHIRDDADLDDGAPDSDLIVPVDDAERARLEASYARFCDVFPDAFYVSQRGRDYVGKPKEKQEKGRLLSAGFHSMMGYYRDDAPLYELILNEDQQRELDALWQELDFITSAPMRQHTGFVWFERADSAFMRDPDFDFARAEDKDVTSEATINKLADVYLAKARRNDASETAVQAIEDHFGNINASIRWVEEARIAAQPSHLDALTEFAERAYRRPLRPVEREDLIAFYRSLREEDRLSHEQAIQDALVAVLMSPHFCYRMDLLEVGEGTRPLTDYELATRLSYFLWSSMPDEELLTCAAAGEVHRPEVLAAQTRRMLADGRVRALAVEFGGNWLDFRRFEEHNSVDRQRFPSFTNELRRAMFEEPIRFFVDLVQQNRSVLDFFDARHTFVNPVLATHYGMPEFDIKPNDWVKVEDASAHERGGLLPMSVFLTKNAPGLRTSPVKRGYWVVHRLLGERIPPPPPEVPELPEDESKLGDLTLPEMLAKHRRHPSCATCHDRIDSFGLVFEGYGPVGERRAKDLGGRPVESTASFPGGVEGTGIDGLRTYIREYRQQDFLDNLCRKMLSYALGRSLLLSDEDILLAMRQDLAANNYRFGNLVERIVTCPQFLTKRGRDELPGDGQTKDGT